MKQIKQKVSFNIGKIGLGTALVAMLASTSFEADSMPASLPGQKPSVSTTARGSRCAYLMISKSTSRG